MSIFRLIFLFFYVILFLEVIAYTWFFGFYLCCWLSCFIVFVACLLLDLVYDRYHVFAVMGSRGVNPLV